MKLSYDEICFHGKEANMKPCIIFIHGMLESKKTWRIVAPEIARKTHRRVYAVDVRNHGSSPWGDELNFDIMADDVEEFMVDHSIPSAVLIGHSLGGRIAMTIALRKPEKVNILIVEESVPRTFKPAPEGIIAKSLNGMKEVLNAVNDTENDNEALSYARDFFLCTVNPMDRQMAVNYHLDMLPLKKQAGKYAWECDVDGLIDMVSTEKIGQELTGVYKGHVLFLYGTKTFFKMEEDTLIPVLFPQAVKLKVDGASHFIHTEHPELFIAEVSKFINENTAVISKY
ncbi:protein ABHD11-like isoform X1 [Uloborus diversus]|uniref:protein ABHD11-like isoform X1 n=2 Tax=Uloborus diversus TaxID=327109 RepID=UPI00240A4C2B|nr:protein ABHD11-like isoform X1 [Uloborus diversus]